MVFTFYFFAYMEAQQVTGKSVKSVKCCQEKRCQENYIGLKGMVCTEILPFFV